MRQYSSDIKPNVPEPGLRTKISSWWSNFKGFMSDWLQTSKMRSAKREAEQKEQEEKRKKANRYVHIQATLSQKELSEIERKQKEITEGLQKGHQAKIDEMRKEEKRKSHEEWLKRVRSSKE